MIEKTLEVLSEEGLHTRPANAFVKLVKDGSSEVRIVKGMAEAPGRNLLKIMKLGIVKGDSITLFCEGPDEASVMSSLLDLVQPGGEA